MPLKGEDVRRKKHRLTVFRGEIAWLNPSTKFNLHLFESVNDKESDVMTYRVRFLHPIHCPSPRVSLTIYVAHKDPEKQTRGGRIGSGGRAEVRLYIPAPFERCKFDTTFLSGCASNPDQDCDLVFDLGDRSISSPNPLRISEIYFVIEDCDTTLPPGYKGGKIEGVHVQGAGPKWHLGSDTSGILARLFPGQWIPLNPLHPSVVDPTVPVHLRPQRHPAWYKYRSSTTLGKEIPGLKGKLSGTKWFKMLGKYPKDGFGDPSFDGNALTRSGRQLETHVTALYLAHLKWARPQVQIYECGSFPHPYLDDVIASPDGIIVNPARTFSSFPGWFQNELRLSYKQAELDSIDFTRGVYECKTMLTNDSKGNGPVFKEEHIPQLYAEMVCAGVFWAEIVRFCLETKEMFMYRVYRKPSIAQAFENVIVRTRKEMTEEGKTLAQVADHPENRGLLTECAKYATYYNEPRTTDSRKEHIGFDAVFHVVADALVAASGVVEETDPNGQIDLSTQTGPVTDKKKTNKKAVAKPGPGAKKRAQESVIKLEPDTLEAGKRRKQMPQEKALLSSWIEIQSTNKQLQRAISNLDWDPIQTTGVLGIQAARYEAMYELLSSRSSGGGGGRRKKTDDDEQEDQEDQEDNDEEEE
jgi:hypothetical protein